MKFKNTTGKDVKVRSGTLNSPKWGTAKNNEIVDLPQEIGLSNNFVYADEEVKESKVEVTEDIDEITKEVKEEVKTGKSNRRADRK